MSSPVPVDVYALCMLPDLMNENENALVFQKQSVIVRNGPDEQMVCHTEPSEVVRGHCLEKGRHFQKKLLADDWINLSTAGLLQLIRSTNHMM